MTELSPVVIAAAISGGLAFGANYVSNRFSDRAKRREQQVSERGEIGTQTQKQIEDWQMAVRDDNARLRSEGAAKDVTIAALNQRITNCEIKASEQDRKVERLERTIADLEATIRMLTARQNGGRMGGAPLGE